MKFTNTITIHRPQTEVFAYLSDLSHLPEWNYALADTRLVTPGPIGVGSRYHQRRTVPVHTEETLEITEFVPDARLTVEGTLNSLPAKLTYSLQPAVDGTTITNTVELQASGARGLLATIAAGRIKSAVATNLSVLKHRLER